MPGQPGCGFIGLLERGECGRKRANNRTEEEDLGNVHYFFLLCFRHRFIAVLIWVIPRRNGIPSRFVGAASGPLVNSPQIGTVAKAAAEKSK
jgi:hypothetical protein